jgi:DNA-binding transcriptional LysR family regulator
LAVALQVTPGPVTKKLSFIDLEKTPLILLPRNDPIREAIDSAAARTGVRLCVYAEFGAIEDVLAAVTDNGHPAILPRFVVARAARAGIVAPAGLSEPRVPLCLFLMMARNRPFTRAVLAARDLLLETIENLVRTDAWPGRYVGQIDSAANLVTIFTNAD